MSYKLYFGVDVSKLWLDIAYYDGVDVDWKHGHIRVDNDEKGFAQLGRWLDRLGTALSRTLERTSVRLTASRLTRWTRSA